MSIFIFKFFFKSKHLSVGTFAVTSLVVFSTISRIESEYPELAYSSSNSTQNSSLPSFDNENSIMNFRIKIATALAFWCGIIQVNKY